MTTTNREPFLYIEKTGHLSIAEYNDDGLVAFKRISSDDFFEYDEVNYLKFEKGVNALSFILMGDMYKQLKYYGSSFAFISRKCDISGYESIHDEKHSGMKLSNGREYRSMFVHLLDSSPSLVLRIQSFASSDDDIGDPTAIITPNDLDVAFLTPFHYSFNPEDSEYDVVVKDSIWNAFDAVFYGLALAVQDAIYYSRNA